MGAFDELMRQAPGLDFEAIGARVGLTPEQVETAARSLLPQIADPAIDNREAFEVVAAGTGIAQPSLEALVLALLEQAQGAGASGGAFEAILIGLRGTGQRGGALDRDGDPLV